MLFNHENAAADVAEDSGTGGLVRHKKTWVTPRVIEPKIKDRTAKSSTTHDIPLNTTSGPSS